MDSFTESILARARERQKMLEGYSPKENNNKPPTVHKGAPETSSDLIRSSPLRENASNISRFSRQNSDTPGSPKTRISSEIPGSPDTTVKTLNIQQENFNMEIKLSSTENVRVEVEIGEEEGDSPSPKKGSGLRDETKKKLNRLGRLYTGGDEADISSPIQRTEANFCINEENAKSETPRPMKGLMKLANLAENMSRWEDFEVRPTPKKSTKPPAPQPPSLSTKSKGKAPEPPVPIGDAQVDDGNAENKSKKLNWDEKMLTSLESQGFTRTDSSSRLVFSYGSPKKYLEKPNEEIKPVSVIRDKFENKPSSPVKPVKVSNAQNLPSSPVKSAPNVPTSPMKVSLMKDKMESGMSSPARLKFPLKTPEIANRAAMFESSPTKKPAKDPALLSVSERKALFEKNKGEALIPKSPFGLAPPVIVETTMKAPATKFMSSKPKEVIKPIIHSEPNRQSKSIAQTVAALMENKTTISQEQIESTVKTERQKEMEMLLNRFNRNKKLNEVLEESEEEEDDDVDAMENSPMLAQKPTAQIVDEASRKPGEKRKSGSKVCTKEDSPLVAAVLNDVKRIKVSPAKVGKLYPNLSDIEATTETETRTPTPNMQTSSEDESDDPNTSFGRDILQAVCKNQTPHKRTIYEESTASDISSVLEDDSYSDDFSVEDNVSVGPTPPKQPCQKSPEKVSTSNSFHYKSFSDDKSKFSSPAKFIEPQVDKKDLPEFIVEGNNVVPLIHTVSFYRKQQNQVKTPVKQITRLPIQTETTEEKDEQKMEVEKKIKELQEEVNRQQNIIAQTSQALNLCTSTPEFSGSTEQVEAERVLLVASHRRQAAFHELQRLRVERTIRPQGLHSLNLPLEKGTLTISNITLPLKQKYVTALAAAGGKGHHIVCLVKCAEKVVPTKLASTVVSNASNPDMELKIPGNIILENIYSDFTITFEVYCLQAQEEFLPHEIKYHINTKKGSSKITPKKSKQESRMVMPAKESPAGPHAVRTSSFAMMGYVVFSVQSINKKVWHLNNTPPMSPLEGSVEMRVNCELAVSVEHRGFLTMFDDVSGFGAWHRRWCLLKGHLLSYWKYPDDEKKMPPTDTIDLRKCITKQVGPVNREICARLHTFLLEREREARADDKNSLVKICKGDKTVIRHLLSADTKEERMTWCSKFNAALTALKMWGNV